jgi:hypothetical protein
MAGRGPAPKDPSRRARSNSDPNPVTLLRFTETAQPALPGGDEKWPQRTREWWAMWGASPQAAHFTATDWEFLLETALLHAKFWSGETSVAGELRLRVAKFGATPEDRARLRMQFAQAEIGEDQAQRRRTSRDRRGALTALPASGE